MNKHIAITAALALTFTLVSMPSAMAADGISRLIAVTTMKSGNANADALEGADKQRDLVKEQKKARSAPPTKSDKQARQQQDTRSSKS